MSEYFCVVIPRRNKTYRCRIKKIRPGKHENDAYCLPRLVSFNATVIFNPRTRVIVKDSFSVAAKLMENYKEEEWPIIDYREIFMAELMNLKRTVGLGILQAQSILDYFNKPTALKER